MAFTVVITTRAYKEIKKSKEWYEAKLKGLGLRFVNALDKKISAIKLHPKIFRKGKVI